MGEWLLTWPGRETMETASHHLEPLRLIAGQPTPRLYDAVIETLRVRHYSRRTERAYIHWIRRFILFDDRRPR